MSFRATAPISQKIQKLDYPAHTEHILSNGVKLITLPPIKNEVVHLLVNWPVGSQFQELKYQSKSALSLSLNGTALNTADQIQAQFDFWGTSISPNPGLLNNEFSIKATGEFFQDSLNWFIANHINALYPHNEVETLIQTATAGLQRKMTTPKYWAYKECMELVFGQNSAMTGFVTIDELGLLESAKLQQFHQKFLSLSNAVYYLAGDYTQNHLEEISTLLGATGPRISHESLASQTTDSKNEVTEKLHAVENTSQVSLFMAKELPEISETEMHHFSLLNLLLGGFFGSRLMQEIREEKGLTYGIGSYIMQTHKGNIWCIAGEMNSKNASLALDETRKILRSFISNPPAGEELERAKRYYSGQLRASFDGPFSMSYKLRNLALRGYTLNHIDTAMDAIWNCTTDELCALADNYLSPQSFKTVLAGDIK